MHRRDRCNAGARRRGRNARARDAIAAARRCRSGNDDVGASLHDQREHGRDRVGAGGSEIVAAVHGRHDLVLRAEVLLSFLPGPTAPGFTPGGVDAAFSPPNPAKN
jgi:hypothetical protein